MQTYFPIIAAVVGSVLASSGFWAFVQRKDATKNAYRKLLIGLAYDKIVTLGMHYIDRGWISRDEYEEFCRNLYEPYREAGGNGVASQIMVQVTQLPFRTHERYIEIAQTRRTPQEMHQNG